MGMLYSRSISEDQHKVLKAQPLLNQPAMPINTYCYITIFVCHYDSLAAAKERYRNGYSPQRDAAMILFSHQNKSLTWGMLTTCSSRFSVSSSVSTNPRPKPKRKTTQPSLSPQSSTFPNAAKAALMISGFM